MVVGAWSVQGQSPQYIYSHFCSIRVHLQYTRLYAIIAKSSFTFTRAGYCIFTLCTHPYDSWRGVKWSRSRKGRNIRATNAGIMTMYMYICIIYIPPAHRYTAPAYIKFYFTKISLSIPYRVSNLTYCACADYGLERERELCAAKKVSEGLLYSAKFSRGRRYISIAHALRNFVRKFKVLFHNETMGKSGGPEG